jgi:hypothetical protein
MSVAPLMTFDYSDFLLITRAEEYPKICTLFLGIMTNNNMGTLLALALRFGQGSI